MERSDLLPASKGVELSKTKNENVALIVLAAYVDMLHMASAAFVDWVVASDHSEAG